MRVGPKTLVVAMVSGITLVVLVRGLRIARFEPVTSDRYLWGAIHVHSTLSDGLAPLEEIASEARDARVGVVLLSDHGAPHPEATLLNETIDGVRFIGGSEVGMPDGHMIVSGAESLPKYKLPPFPPHAVADVDAWGGVSVLTYPEDPTHRWQYWEEDFAPDGIEIINVTSYFRASSIWKRLDWALFSIFNRHYYIRGFTAPDYALGRWDELLTRAPVWGFYAANAHGGFPVTEELTVGVPSYATAFSYAGFGIDRELAGDPELAIRRGEFFSIIRAAGEPNRFDFALEPHELIRVVVEAPELSPRIVLKRDGAVIAETTESELRHPTSSPGVYRAEIYLEDHPLLAPDVPWILSNPIFVDVEFSEVGTLELVCTDVNRIALSELHVEKDVESTATLEYEPEGELTLSYHLSQATEENVDRWVALARREPVDLSDYRGVYVSGRGPEPMRYWIELRAGDRGYYATFKVAPDAPATTIPWQQFYPTLGERKPIPLSEVDALFVAVNTSNSYTGFSSQLTLSELGWCR